MSTRRISALLGGTAVITVVLAGTLAATTTAATAKPVDPVANAVAAVTAHGAQTAYSTGQSFTIRNVITDLDGTTHVRMNRYYHGLPVLGGDLVAHLTKDGSWKGVSQTLTSAPQLSVQPRIAAAHAGAIALASSTALARRVDGSQLVVDAGDGPASLAYEVVVGGVRADSTPSELHVLVDATTGRISDSWDAIKTDVGTGHGFHVGDVLINVAPHNSGGFELTDAARGGHKTYNLNGGTSGTGTLVTSATTTFGNGTLSDPNSVAVDVHYGAAVTWDYYLNTHGRNGIRNDGVGAFSRVHYSTNYINAFWSDSCFCMTYGDGDLSQGWTPLTSIDVAGHEMTHGVTSATANLRYSGEPGGLNEGTSDIFGSLVEFSANNANDPGDYLIGEELQTSGQPLRWMNNPSLDGASANCWSRNVGRLDVHYSSGVANHFFFMLAVGSGNTPFGSSPTCNGAPAVTGIGNAKAGAIWYRALTVYMNSRTNYKGARTATLSAASDLYGPGSVEFNTVAAAWTAVNVI